MFKSRFKNIWEMAVGADENGPRWVGYTDNLVWVTAGRTADLLNTVTQPI
jgi:hypothetical protein